MALSYLDKAIIFLLPLLVLTLFDDKNVYVSIEYIYSIVVVIVPLLNLGLNGYFFYSFRNSKHKREVISRLVRTFHFIYLSLFVIGTCLIIFHFLFISFEDNILFIVVRATFVFAYTFLTSYYRLIDKARKALSITISANIISLFFVFSYLFIESEFQLWVVFSGQIIFCVFYFIKILKRIVARFEKYFSYSKIYDTVKRSFLYSWPSIIQVFILMYIANYGKMNALKEMSINDGVLLSLVQRFSMLIQLTHAGIVGFLMKDIFVSGASKSINKKLLAKYLGLLSFSVLMVLLSINVYAFFAIDFYELEFIFLISSYIVGYTTVWCIYSYLEIYFSREDKNIIKLYLAIAHGILFILIFNALELSFLERITYSMFWSAFITLLISIFTLRARKFRLS